MVAASEGLFEWQDDQLAMLESALGDDMVREVPDLVGQPLEDRHLQAARVVEVDVKGRDRHVVVVVETVRESLGQLPPGVIVGVDERRDAGLQGTVSGETCRRPARAKSRIASDLFWYPLASIRRSMSAIKPSSKVMVTRCMSSSGMMLIEVHHTGSD